MVKYDYGSVFIAFGCTILGLGLASFLSPALSYQASDKQLIGAAVPRKTTGPCPYPHMDLNTRISPPKCNCAVGYKWAPGKKGCIPETSAPTKPPANPFTNAITDAFKNKKKSGGNTNSTGPPVPRGGSSGRSGTVNGPNVYKVIRPNACGCVDEGEKVLHTDGGKCTGVTVRVNCNNCDLDNYEATGIMQFTSDCKCGGPEATIKMLGPAGHSSDNPGCCWEIGTVNQNGAVGFNMEGPHPKTSNPKPENDGNAGNAGSLVNKRVGIKSIVWKISSGYHHEVWVDPTGSGTRWTRYAQRNVSSWGVESKKSVRPAAQQIEFRNDCHGAKWSGFRIDAISPP